MFVRTECTYSLYKICEKYNWGTRERQPTYIRKSVYVVTEMVLHSYLSKYTQPVRQARVLFVPFYQVKALLFF